MEIVTRLIENVSSEEIARIAAIEADNFGAGALNQWHLPVVVRYGKVFVIEVGDVIAGAAELIADWEQPENVFIVGFSISKPYQGRGLGKKLIEAIINYARDDGRHSLLLTAAEDNTPALRLYGKFGFRKVKVLRDEYGSGINRRLMRLELDGEGHE